jgi:hypothetical protein
MAEADALALVAIARRELARFTDFAVQIRYDDQPELQNLDRAVWNNRVEVLLTSIEAQLPPSAEP